MSSARCLKPWAISLTSTNESTAANHRRSNGIKQAFLAQHQVHWQVLTQSGGTSNKILFMERAYNVEEELSKSFAGYWTHLLHCFCCSNNCIINNTILSNMNNTGDIIFIYGVVHQFPTCWQKKATFCWTLHKTDLHIYLTEWYCFHQFSHSPIGWRILTYQTIIIWFHLRFKYYYT